MSPVMLQLRWAFAHTLSKSLSLSVGHKACLMYQRSFIQSYPSFGLLPAAFCSYKKALKYQTARHSSHQVISNPHTEIALRDLICIRHEIYRGFARSTTSDAGSLSRCSFATCSHRLAMLRQLLFWGEMWLGMWGCERMPMSKWGWQTASASFIISLAYKKFS